MEPYELVGDRVGLDVALKVDIVPWTQLVINILSTFEHERRRWWVTFLSFRISTSFLIKPLINLKTPHKSTRFPPKNFFPDDTLLNQQSDKF